MATQPVKPSTNPRQGQGTKSGSEKPNNASQKPATSPASNPVKK
jgi:hypothetical protein